ncbi:MAG: 5'/3'-nucleotidase SurE [Bacteroidota bacterium]|nr:5'/3'-nucleotidase SurE [Bacteroidota bacterium]
MSREKPLILVTNDDGYKAPGIRHLVEVARKFGEVLLVGPMKGQSGMSHAVTLHEPIRLKKISEEPGLRVFACSGTPADCVKIALNQILDVKPDLLLSGINHGSNASVSLFYSGTVAAAVEGCMNSIPSIAFSVDNHSIDADFRLAVHYIGPVIRAALKNGMPDITCLNINFPDVPKEECKGIRVCRQTKGVWKEEFEHRVDPQGRDYYWLTGFFSNEEPKETDTDEYLMQQKYAAIVPIKVDVTDYEAIKAIGEWELEN